MAIDARFHLHRQELDDWILFPHVAMADAALDSLGNMPAMTEEDKIGQTVDR